ncbi:hypothetical protein [Pseudoxanthomonas sp. CF125]|uniref:hypothetical protein n=1 Tax=Pseudoxanthomonas sp. CF125 TaxID=1855303 RepID=UPI0008891A7F|nr:hypothetical protein [Pseudoxanthomonas sp. CF125]SDR22025.1 hypothetical protein SAMN05216569_3651 [Pseudoxanthomonas sp. CF125]
MKALFFSLVFAQFTFAPASAQPLEEQTRNPAPATSAPRPKTQPPTVRAAQDPRTDPYGALVENVSRSADQFRDDNTSRNQDRDRIEDADYGQPAATSDKKPRQRKPKRPSP